MERIPYTTHEQGEKFTPALWAQIERLQRKDIPKSPPKLRPKPPTKLRTHNSISISDVRYLNMPFKDSVKHHITDTLLVHIPNLVHQYIRHDRTTGEGMATINMIALLYLEQSCTAIQYLSTRDITRNIKVRCASIMAMSR